MRYKQALLDNNIEFDASLFYLCNNYLDFEGVIHSAKKLICDYENNVDALATVNDLLVIGALNYFNANKIKVSGRIALMGLAIGLFLVSLIETYCTCL